MNSTEADPLEKRVGRAIRTLSARQREAVRNAGNLESNENYGWLGKALAYREAMELLGGKGTVMNDGPWECPDCEHRWQR